MAKVPVQVRSLVDREWSVLIVDYDSDSVLILENMLQSWNFKVTKCLYAKDAVSMLQKEKIHFDIVIFDSYTPDKHGFELLERICLEMDLPIILTSKDDNEDLIRKQLIIGACDYLIHFWKCEYQKQRKEVLMKAAVEQSGSYSSDLINMNGSNSWDYRHKVAQNENIASISDDEKDHKKCMKKRKTTSVVGDQNFVKVDAISKKKQRVIWTPELHDKFVAAINQFGNAKPVPKKIMEMMNVPELTRENVASHLQKYRQYQKRAEQRSKDKIENAENLMSNSKASIKDATPMYFESQIQPTSSSLQVQGFTSWSSQPQIDMPKIELENHTQVVHHEVDVEGGNVFYRPFASCAYPGTPDSLFINGEPTYGYTDIYQGDTFENPLLYFGYTADALYVQQNERFP